MQIAFGLALVLVAQGFVLPAGKPALALATLTLGCLGWQAYRIRPYTRLHRLQVQPARRNQADATLTLFVANVLQDNRDAAALLERIRQADPDLVLTLESNGWWDRQLELLCDRYPHAVRHPLENTYGMHLFSRLTLRDVVVQERLERDIPSIFARVQLRSGIWVDLHCLHPEPPQIGNDTAERDAELLLVAKQVAKDGRPTVVLGDLNDVAWSATTRLFQRLSGMLDPRVGRGLYATFHAQHWFARWPLDHVFHDTCFRLARLEVLPEFGLDHFAVLVSLVYQPDAEDAQEAPDAKAEDREDAAERIQEGRAAAREAGTAPARAPAAATALQADR